MLTQLQLKEHANYDPLTGVFTRKNTLNKNHPAGEVLGSNSRGYLLFSIKGRLVAAHRMAWLYEFGETPAGDIDHKNRVRSDNRIENLRVCRDETDNKTNLSMNKLNTSGFTGVRKAKKNLTKPWIAEIRSNKKGYYLGHFATPEEASQAYQEAKKRLHVFKGV